MLSGTLSRTRKTLHIGARWFLMKPVVYELVSPTGMWSGESPLNMSLPYFPVLEKNGHCWQICAFKIFGEISNKKLGSALPIKKQHSEVKVTLFRPNFFSSPNRCLNGVQTHDSAMRHSSQQMVSIWWRIINIFHEIYMWHGWNTT